MYLNTHSYYSLRYGTLSIETLIEQAKALNIKAMALTDINNSTGMPDFIKTCNENGIKPIAGMEIRNKDTLLYTLLAKNNEGFSEINRFVSDTNLQKQSYPVSPPFFHHVHVIFPFGKKKYAGLKENEWIGIRPEDPTKLVTTEFNRNQSRLLIQQPVTFAGNTGYELHKNLRAIDHNTIITKLTEGQMAKPSETMMHIDDLLIHYEHNPQIIKNTEKLVEECIISMDFKSLKNKKTFTGSVYDDQLLLEKLTHDGMEYRYGKNNIIAQQRIEKELDIIVKLGFASYFLIAWDIIRYSMSRGFYHVGRGSGANSIVAFCLKITDVDPIELNLYFERFLNPKRTSPPDFDIDYSWTDRDEVQDYIFKRYGREHTALLGAMSTFKGKSIYRELGKVHGLPKNEIDRLIDYPNDPLNKNEVTKKIHHFAEMMKDFPNLRSIHAGGVLISEKPIYCYTALDLPPKGFPTTQWDMYIAEDIGFEKLDILSQRGIGHICEAAEIISKNRKIDIDVHQVEKFKQDKKVRAQLKRGEAIGCFYIESPAMRGLLNKLRCSNYLSLVAASSIIRPGVAKSGMMKEYIKRFHHPNNFSYLHPVLKEQLEETYGVMVYQEDVIKVCHHFAQLDLADADVLRRAMSGKYRSKKELQRIVNKFFENCSKLGYPEKLTREVWRQIESFAGYAFSKAHSASYAVESFQSLYLKTYFPKDFMVAVINNFGGFYHGWVYFNEAKRWGANVNLPCVNHSRYKTCIIDDDIFIGFIHIQHLETKIGQFIAPERKRNGPFTGLEDFLKRVPSGLEQMLILIRTGAFRFTGKSKAQLLWQVHLLLGKNVEDKHHNALFSVPQKKFILPKLEHNPLEDAYDELDIFGFPVSMSDFDMLKTGFRGETMARDLKKHVGKTVRMVGNMVTIKYVKTVKREIMHFGTFLDTTGDFFDTTHFPNSLKYYPFKGRGVYLLLGKIVEEFGFPGMEVQKMAKLPFKADPRE